MRTTTAHCLTILAALIAPLMLTGCAGPAGRHHARVDRRYDAVERTETRVSNRHDNRDDRRDDRRDRVETRYGY